MGIVNRDNRFNDLIKVIKSSKLNNYEKKELIDYVNEVKTKKRNNDFFEDEFLERVILKIVTKDELDCDFDLSDLLGYVNYIFPFGTKTEDYDMLKELFISNIGELNAIFNDKFFALFDNKRDYVDIINIISNDEDFDDEIIDAIFNYAIDVAPFCQNQSILKNEVISFIGKVFRCNDLKTLSKESLEEAKKRVGVYSVNEKTLSLIASEAKKAQNLIEKLENLQKRVNNYQKDVDTITKKGIEELQTFIDKEKDAMIAKLDDYLLEIEKQLKDSSDQVFNKILMDAQKKINEIKLMASSLSRTTTDELLRIQSKTNESVQTLKDYVENDPQVRKLIQEAGGEAKVRELLSSIKLTGTPMVSAPVIDTPGIYIPGNDRLVVPMNSQVVLPDNIESNVLPLFDESIPFDERMKAVEQRMKDMRDHGEIFHGMTEEVVRCVMEGDWVYLWGPSGCGKSYVIKQVARILGIDLVENGKITDKYSVMAYNDPHGRFRATQAFVALVYGKMLSFDEFDNGDPDTQVVLNELYSGLLDVLERPEEKRFVTFAEDMSVPIHPNFRMISAGNTDGQGPDENHSSRGKIDEAVQERMTPKRFYYDNVIEGKILDGMDAWYLLFTNFRKVCDLIAPELGREAAQGIITTRDASALAKYVRHNSKSLEQVLREKFIQVKDNNYLNLIAKKMQKEYQFSDSDIDDVEDKTLRSYSKEELGKKLIYTCKQVINTGRR